MISVKPPGSPAENPECWTPQVQTEAICADNFPLMSYLSANLGKFSANMTKMYANMASVWIVGSSIPGFLQNCLMVGHMISDFREYEGF